MSTEDVLDRVNDIVERHISGIHVTVVIRESRNTQCGKAFGVGIVIGFRIGSAAKASCQESVLGVL